MVISILVIIICIPWILNSAFGPTSRTVNLKLNNGAVLICKETYNADIHSISYDVDFKLLNGIKDTIEMGNTSYSNQNWEKNLELKIVGDWYVLPVTSYGNSKLLLAKCYGHESKDTTLSPQDLRDNSLWTAIHSEIPDWAWPGTTEIDSIKDNRFFVKYEYRIGDPFIFYLETIELEMDNKTGILKTKKIFDRKENASSHNPTKKNQ